VRPGVARAGEDLAALTGLEVAEVKGGEEGSGGIPPVAPVLIGTEAVLHRVGSASVVVFLDFDQELLAPRYRAGEQALALLALASRVVGGRRRQGRVVVRTRLADHEVLEAAMHSDPGRLAETERPRRELLRLPPTTALAVVSGDGAAQFAIPLAQTDGTVEVGGLGSGRFLVRATDSEVLAAALESAGGPGPGIRIEVGPRHV
jgi:primosomal protein N' (replication factor Y)